MCSSLFPRKLLKLTMLGRSSDLLPFLNAFPFFSFQLSVISYQSVLWLFTVHCLLFTDVSSGKSVVQNVLFNNCQLWIINCQLSKELTAAGLYRNYTCFPFNHFPPNGEVVNQSGAKVMLFSELENRGRAFFWKKQWKGDRNIKELECN